ncbi:hypothetical protein [Calidifontibacillus oryziterrae]|uniref:hypothetical protein n=1 Tax=Calidifontibacillus oryziterrae TaxID=1191699 RepID=UPI0003098276|nr:hypothetical protein [Calidifontibacillus oryziterrae]
MFLVILYGIITVLCVFFAIKKQKLALLSVPFLGIFGYLFIKILMVPLPFWETVQFIFDLR